MSTSVDDETILEVLRSNDAPRMTTTEVAGQLPITRGTTRTRLQQLVDEGLLERKTEGNNVVWWLPERADELEAWEAEQEAAETAEETEEEEAEPGSEAETEDTEVEVEPAEQSKAETEEGPTEVEVEAVSESEDEAESEGTETAVETPDEETETRTAADRPELSEDEEGLRALAFLAAAVVAFLLLRKLLGGDGESEA